MMVRMTYRGTVKNGVIVLESGFDLPDGQPVEITTLPADSAAATDLPGFGLWRDRADLSDAAAGSLRLRQAIERRAE
jgi:hypothetical protein